MGIDTRAGNRWTVVVGALIVQLILGTVYAFSVFVRPLQAEFGWDRATTQWAFSMALATFAITMIPAGRLQDRIGPRRVATIGGILLGLSFLLASVLVAQDRPWALYLTLPSLPAFLPFFSQLSLSSFFLFSFYTYLLSFLPTFLPHLPTCQIHVPDP